MALDVCLQAVGAKPGTGERVAELGWDGYRCEAVDRAVAEGRELSFVGD